MKKLLAMLLVLAAIVPAAACADLPDISNLSFEELVQLKDQINLAIWNSQEWQEVTVPIGMWKIGEDIPAGHWTITPIPDTYCSLWYGDVVNETGTDVGYGWDFVNGYNSTMSTRVNRDGSWKDPDCPHSVDLVVKDGWYIKTTVPMIFTPYAGKPDLGFN